MAIFDKVSTGLKGFDQVIDNLRPGDNVVWQVDSASDYEKMVTPYVREAKIDNRNLVYIRFGRHKPIVADDPDIKTFNIEPGKGFELFANEVHNIIKGAGRKTFFVFDCLTDLLEYWYSDLMIGNFFKVTCPYLYELDTVAYFAIIRGAHMFTTIAGIRETTQLLLDLYRVNDKLYIHPLKVWQRYSPTMFFPHLIQEQEAICITASSEVSELFSSFHRGEERLDYWNITFNKAKEALKLPPEQQESVKKRLMHMLIGGQSPIIVRSSSLLEDNFGNAFAGKYESVFCANQGTPEERYECFEQAVRTVYASTMNEDALEYRINRGLFDMDEQMAILVQRVSGDQYSEGFFPHLAGVGNSSNLYVWDKNIDMDAGMLRLVFGLGTRAVDRTASDYAKIVCLDDPLRIPPMDYYEQKKYTQRGADIISLQDNALISVDLEEIFAHDIKTDKSLFASPDTQAASRLRELGYSQNKAPYIFDFSGLLKNTEFPSVMKDMLALLSKIYDYPVDIEFTVNFNEEKKFKINLLQCRPLQTRGLGKPVNMPIITKKEDCLFSVKGNFMGGNVHLPVDYVIYVDTQAYKQLNEQSKYAVARQIGVINSYLKTNNVMLIGPGRWGTTTPSLGVPVKFAELCYISVVCELSSAKSGFMSELSYGSHFFQDLVESGIFYAGINEDQKDVIFNPELLLRRENILVSISPQYKSYADVIHVSGTDGMEIFSDIITQTVLCGIFNH